MSILGRLAEWRYVYDGRYLVRDRLRYLLRPVCWFKCHIIDLSPSEDWTAYCVRCHDWPLNPLMYYTPQEWEAAKARAAARYGDLLPDVFSQDAQD